MNLIERFAYRKLLKEAADVKRQIILPSPDSIRKVCVLWQPMQEQAFKYLHNYFLHSQVIFRNLCIYRREAILAASTNIITPKDLNWMGFPKEGVADEFIKSEYDLLLNIALEQSPVLHYLTAFSRAHFKIGWTSTEPNFFDLNIQINNRNDALYLAQQQIYYLEQLNKKT